MFLGFHQWIASRYYLLVAEKPLLGKRRARSGPLLTAVAFLTSGGAIIGRAKRDRVLRLWDALAEGSSLTTTEILEHLSLMADNLRAALQPEPDSFYRLAIRLQLPGLPDDQAMLVAGAQHRAIVPEKNAYLQLQTAVIRGIALGVTHPDIVQRIWQRESQSLSPERTARARAAGLELLGDGQPLSLDEAEHDLLLELLQYASERNPSLIEALGLWLS